MKKLIFKKVAKDISLFFLISITCVATIVWIIQAVNYLDLVSEDGHSLRVYFLYTIFSLPKILSNILPFMYMISLFYVLIQYELNNELIIYWINGITKLSFINLIIKISIIYFFIQLILTTLIVPYSLDKGRSYFRTSNIDLFSSSIKEKKFIDSVEDLTIFVEKKENNLLRNIIIKEKINDKETQIIIAQNGKFFIEDNISRKIILNNGKIINTKNDDQNIVDFSKFSLDLSKFNTSTITNQKTQEMNTLNLIRCINEIEIFKKKDKITKNKSLFKGCNLEISDSILEEFLKRFFAPIFIILIGLTSSMIITSSKDQNYYRAKNFIKFFLGIIFLISSEIILSLSIKNFNDTIIFFSVPIISFFTIYIYLFFNNQNLRRN